MSKEVQYTREKIGVLGVLGRIFIFLLTTVLLVAFAAYTVGYVVCHGPSKQAQKLFVMSLRETSAMYWLPDLYFSAEEIEEITGVQAEAEYVETDTTLVTIAAPEESATQSAGPVADEWGLVDEDGDGLIVCKVKGEGYSGYMMVVKDPHRVIMGCDPNSLGKKGYTVAEMVEKFGAVAGINAGGFQDNNGQGDGSTPDSLIVYKGKTYYQNFGVRNGFVGFDDNCILHVGKLTAQEIKDQNIQYGVCFGPALVINGEPQDVSGMDGSVNPRTAIGQRSDGAVLLLVIDGRQVISLGATYTDLEEIMIEYGAVNACNLDGGSSTLMWYDGDYINNCASVVGIRYVPTTFLVLKEGENGYNGE